MTALSSAGCSSAGWPAGARKRSDLGVLRVVVLVALAVALGLTPVVAFAGLSDSTAVSGAAGPRLLGSPTVVLAPSFGRVASFVNVTGSGYNTLTALNLTFDTTIEIACLGSTTNMSDSSGNFACMFVVPTLAAGSYLVNASDGTNAGSASFTIQLPSLYVVPTSGQVTSSVTANGSGYDPLGTPVVLTFGPDAITACTTGGLVADATGAFACTFTVPPLTQGAYAVTATGTAGENSTTYSIDLPSLAPYTASGNVTNQFALSGTGFAPSVALTLTFGPVTIPSTACISGGLTTDPSGAFACTFSVPEVPAGPEEILVSDSSNTGFANYTVEPFFFIVPTQGNVSTTVGVTGYGYDASHAFNVTYDWTDQVCLSTTDARGNLACSFEVPASTLGDHLITVHEGAFNHTETFSVVSNATVTPGFGVAGFSPTLSGTGFAAITDYAYCLSVSVVACPTSVESFVTDSTGNVPSGVLVSTAGFLPGVYQVVVSLGLNVIASTRYVVTSATLALTPTSGIVGATITLIGSMFLGGAQYSYCFASAEGSCPGGSPQFTATLSGDIPGGTTLVVPFTPDGAYVVNVVESGAMVAAAAFQVNASLAVAPSSGPVGLVVAAAGNGLDATAPYVLSWAGSDTVCTGETNASGSFSCQFTIPAATAGPTTVSVSVAALHPSVLFTVLPSLSLSPSTGSVGSTVQATGAGFPASVVYSVVWNGSGFVCGGTTSVLGAFSCSGTVPSEPAGSYAVNGSVGATFAQALFTVVASVSLSDSTGFAGTSITAGGAGFDASQTYTVTWDGSQQLCSGLTAAGGTFSCTFLVPVAVNGLHTVTATEGAFSPSTQFTVGASLALSPAAGTVGMSVVVTGDGYAAAGAYAVLWGGATSVCSGTTQSNGAFTCRFTVPNTAGGPVSVLAAQGSNEAGAQFTVGPSVALGTGTGTVGSTVAVTGHGLAPEAPVTVSWDNSTTVCSGSANASGEFNCTFPVPWSAAGTHSVAVVQGSPVATSSFTVLPAFVSSVATAPAGSFVSVVGTGFDANSAFTVSWNTTTVLCSGTTNATGSFYCDFLVPAGAAGGLQSITVVEGGHQLGVPFTVAASPSPSSTAPFPWWIVVVIALVVGFLLLMILVGERQRHAAHRSRSTGYRPRSGIGSGFAAGVGGSGSPSGPGTSAGVSSGQLAAFDSVARPSEGAVGSTDSPEDIDAMIARLERMSEQLFKKKPADLGDVRTAQLPAGDEPPSE